MEHNVVLTEDDVLRLRQWHATHFPGQQVPSVEPFAPTSEDTATAGQQFDNEDDLGFYSDGARRTLTNSQIAMFRYSEIQRIIQERNRVAEREEQRKERRQQKQDKAVRGTDIQRGWTKHFDEAHQSVDTLMYDEESNETTQPEIGSKKFLWPKLGR